MTTEKIVVSNYTAEQTAQAVEMYQAGQAVEAIAMTLGKSAASIVAKLAREKVYVAKAKPSQPRVTKADLIYQIAAKTGADVEALASFGKADKAALEALLAAV